MRSLGIIVGLLLLLAILAAGFAFLQRDELRAWQTARRSGQVFAEAEQARRRAEDRPDDAAALSSYADALLREGNLGRALYLTELYGAQQPDAAALREEIEASIRAGAEQEFHSVSESAVGQKYKAEPLFQALLFLDGYRHALLGDWASARNYFEAIQPHSLAEPLRPYAQYYLARAYRLAGSDEQKTAASEMWEELLDSEPPADLSTKTRYNLIAYYLSEAYEVEDGEQRAKALLGAMDAESGWPYQRALVEFGLFYTGKADVPAAWKQAQLAVQADGNAESEGTALELCLEILARPDLTMPDPDSDDPPLVFDEVVGEAMVEASQEPAEVQQVIVALKSLRTRFKLATVPGARGLARAYAVTGNVAAASALRAEAMGYGAMAKEAMLFNIAEAEAAGQQWNAALADYKACANLGGSRAGEAWYQCYHILKRVQDPLNLDAAEGYLENAIKAGAKGEAHHKALEELIPLVGNRDNLSPVVEAALNDVMNVAEDSQTAEELRLLKMVQAWGNRVSSERPAWKVHPHQRHIWSYYEILDVYPPQLESSDELPFSGSGHAAEYFAGLGLIDLAAETSDDKESPTNELLAYWQLHNREPTASQEVLAWYATEELEEGQFQSEPATKYALALAYPRPFDDIVLPAARKFAVPPALMYAIIKKESGFKTGAVSGQGAEGLMQVMPDTASFLNNTYNLGIDLSRRTEPKNNVMLGAANLRMLFDQLGKDNIRAVISAHNKGAGNYQKWRAQYPGADDVLFTELIPNEENEQFTKLVWKYYVIYKWLEDSQ